MGKRKVLRGYILRMSERVSTRARLIFHKFGKTPWHEYTTETVGRKFEFLVGGRENNRGCRLASIWREI